jgi:hypothetical protein
MKTAFAGGSTRTYMKVVVDGLDDRVVGIHMLGSDAPEIVQSLAVAITCGATKRDFDRTLAVHPTAAEEFVLMREPVRREDAAHAARRMRGGDHRRPAARQQAHPDGQQVDHAAPAQPVAAEQLPGHPQGTGEVRGAQA